MTKLNSHTTFFRQTYSNLPRLGATLKMIDDLPVCPGLYDPALVDMAESKSKSLLYFVDPKGAIVDGEIINIVKVLL